MNFHGICSGTQPCEDLDLASLIHIVDAGLPLVALLGSNNTQQDSAKVLHHSPPFMPCTITTYSLCLPRVHAVVGYLNEACIGACTEAHWSRLMLA